MPSAAIAAWSASTPSSACWWQWTWTSARCPGATTAAARASACSASTSAKVRTPSASRAASGSSGSSSGPSARRAAVHDGSSPTTGTPAASHGSIVRRLRRSTRRAVSTWPVVVQVSAQQTVRGGSSTAYPRASSTATASAATAGSKWFVKVSGQRRRRGRASGVGTGGRWRRRAGRRDRSKVALLQSDWCRATLLQSPAATARAEGRPARVNGRRAIGGIARSGAIPPSRFATAPSGPRAAAFSASTTRAGSRPTRCSHRGSAPIE